MAKSTTLKFEEARFDAAVSSFLRTLLPAVVDSHVRTMAVDVVDHTARGLNGAGGTPKRIDTGRLRAGWRVALQSGGLPVPASAVGASTSRPGDGEATLTRGTHGVEGIEVRNNVEYARYVEEGTETLDPPGKHLERGLRIVRSTFPRQVGPGSMSDDVQKAWNGRKP